MNKTCFFTGHRKIQKSELEFVLKGIKNETQKMISLGVTDFISEGAVGFDLISASMVAVLRDNFYPQIKLIFALPCKEQSKFWGKKEQEAYKELLEKGDKIIYTSENYFDGCMHKRNRYMVDNSSFCICYLLKETGGTAYTVAYAESKEVVVFNIAESFKTKE